MSRPQSFRDPGPFRVDQIRDGDQYELSNGHAIFCAPGGGDHGKTQMIGAFALDTDPAVESAGIDVGFTTRPGQLRAPDVAIGGVPDRPGWVEGAPPLAVEYAAKAQDEEALQERVAELLEMGTRLVWVVRLAGPRHVEVYEAGQPPRVVGPGQVLVAPGILKNPVRVEALWDREASYQAGLRNLLERAGYLSLDEVRDEGRDEGRVEGRVEGHEAGRAQAQREALRVILGARGVALSEAQSSRIDATTDEVTLRTWLARAAVADSMGEVFDR